MGIKGTTETRVCKICHGEQPLDNFLYGKARKSERVCRACKREFDRKRRKQRSKEPRAKERRCKLCGKVKPAEDFSPNPNGFGGLAARCKECRRPQCREYNRKIRQDPVLNALLLERNRSYKRRNPIKMRDYQRIWMKLHPGYFRIRLAGAWAGDLTVNEWASIIRYYGSRCAYCGKRKKLQLEHIIPLSRGGKHTASNVVPSCKPCNCRKWKRTPEEAGMALLKPHPFVDQSE